MTNNPGPSGPTPSDVVGERVRQLRRDRKLTVPELAAMCATVGYPELTRDAIYTIESGRRLEGRRRRTVTVDELLAFARVFEVPAFELLPAVAPTIAHLERMQRYIEGMLLELMPALERYRDELRAQAEQGIFDGPPASNVSLREWMARPSREER